MKCGKCKKEGVTNEHVRRCYGLRPRQTSNATVDIDRYPKANEVRAREDARQQAERERKQETERKRQERERKQAEDREAARRKSAGLVSEAQKARAELERQRKANECKACGRVPDINGRCNCS